MANLRADNLTGTGGRNALDGSVAFLGDKDALQVPAGSDFAYGTGDFTIEAWIRPHGVASGEAKGIFTQTQSGNEYVKFFINSDKTIKATFGSDTITGGMVEVGSWSHVAVTRASNTVKVFVNGVASSGTSVTTDFTDTTRKPTIGQYTHSFGTLEYYGYISNFRIVKGTAVYTTDFTPPTEKLTAVAGTVLLCCQDSDNELQEATGKTITGYGNLDTTQTEKINGRFNQDPTGNGWSLHTDASGSYANGQWTVTSPATIWKGAYTSFTSIIGQQYRLTGLVVTSNNWGSISVSNDGGAAKIVNPGWNAGSTFPLTINVIFTATATTTYISIDNLNTTNTTATTVQYVSVKPVEVGKAPKVLSPVGIDEGVTFEGDTKVNSQGYMYFPTGDTSQRGRGRGLYTLGYSHPSGGERSEIEYFNIQSQGNSIQFGNLTATKYNLGSGSSATRGVFCGGYDGTLSPSDTDIKNIDYVTIATQGNAQDFGDRTQVGRSVASASSATRVCMATAFTGAGYQATIDYITTASTGDAISFGSLGAARTSMCNASASPTRGVFAGGYEVSPVAASVNTMEYITMASTSSAVDFGDLTSAARDSYGGTASSNTRGCIVLANATPAGLTASTDYITIASKGNALNFGNLTDGRDQLGSCSNSIRGVFIGGRTPNYTNIMDYITIASTGNAQDFGDISYAAGTSALGAALSDSHGGLS